MILEVSQHSIGAMEEGQRRFGSQAFRKASTFGRFQILRSAHIFRSVACDTAALGVQSPSIHVDSTSLKLEHMKQNSFGAMDCYVTVKSLSVGQ